MSIYAMPAGVQSPPRRTVTPIAVRHRHPRGGAVDAVAGLALAALVLLLVPGVAVAGVIALVVLIACATSLGIGRLRRSRRRTGRRA